MPKQREELEQFEEYCQEYYDELNPTPEPEVESQPDILSIQPELPSQPQVQLELDQSELIKLLQQQVKQQAQIIALLQAQAKTFEHQAQTIETLQNKVDHFERFHQQIGSIYHEQFSQVDSEQPTTSTTPLNF